MQKQIYNQEEVLLGEYNPWMEEKESASSVLFAALATLVAIGSFTALVIALA